MGIAIQLNLGNIRIAANGHTEIPSIDWLSMTPSLIPVVAALSLL